MLRNTHGQKEVVMENWFEANVWCGWLLLVLAIILPVLLVEYQDRDGGVWGRGIIIEPKEPSPRAPHAVKAVDAILAELTCVHQRLSSLLIYIRSSSK